MIMMMMIEKCMEFMRDTELLEILEGMFLLENPNVISASLNTSESTKLGRLLFGKRWHMPPPTLVSVFKICEQTNLDTLG